MEKQYSLVPLELTAQGETLDHHNDAKLAWMNLLPVPCKFFWHEFLPVDDEEHDIIHSTSPKQNNIWTNFHYEIVLLYLSWEPWLAFAFFILPCSWIYVRTPKTCCLQPRSLKVSKLTTAQLACLQRIDEGKDNNETNKEPIYFRRYMVMYLSGQKNIANSTKVMERQKQQGQILTNSFTFNELGNPATSYALYHCFSMLEFLNSNIKEILTCLYLAENSSS